MSFRPTPKKPPFRSQTMRDLAVEAPHCMRCFATNVGQVVGAHLDALWAGKGTGQKSHDLVAYLCGDCHAELSGVIRRGLTGEECEHQHLRAIYLSTVWLFQSGHAKVSRFK